MKITINDKDITLKFGYGCLRRLSDMWGVDTFDGVLGRFASLDGLSNEQMGFSHLDIFIDTIVASAYAADINAYVDRGDVGDYLLGNPEAMAGIITEFMKSMPQQKADEPGNPKPPKKAEPKPANP